MPLKKNVLNRIKVSKKVVEPVGIMQNIGKPKRNSGYAEDLPNKKTMARGPRKKK